MKVLLTTNRSGSTFVQKNYIEPFNAQFGAISIRSPFTPINDIPLTDIQIEEQIINLQQKKEQGIEYTFKYHINYLRDYYNTWFKEFYRDDQVLVLKRKDKWKWFLSFLFQDCTSWKHCHWNNEKLDFDFNHNWDYHKTLKQFFSFQELLGQVEGEVIYYEDIAKELHTNDPALAKNVLSNYIDYSSYFDIDIIRKEFDKWQ
jgi:hypothetical protein